MRFIFLNLILLWSVASLALPEEARVFGGVALVNLGQISTNPNKPKVSLNNKPITVVSHAQQWVAVVGLTVLDKSPEASISIAWPNKKDKKASEKIAIADKQYAESRIVIKDKDKVTPPERDWDRIIAENKLIMKAKNYWLNEDPNFAFVLPASGPFSSRFGLRRFFNDQPRKPHRGLDIASPTGTPIYAPADGIVSLTGDFFFTGQTVFMAHGGSLVSFYAHMSRIDVKDGQRVKQGDLLGAIGATGRVTGAHLHWSVGLNGVWVDPIYFLDPADRPN